MMNNTTKECNGKNAYTNQVCHTLPLRGTWNLTSRVGEGIGEGEREEKQKNFSGGIVLIGKYSLGSGCPIGLPQCKTSKISTCHDETVTLTFNLT